MSVELHSVVITGERSAGRHLVVLGGDNVWLTSGRFSALCQLVHARATTRLGYIRTSDLFTPVTIHRLRRSIGHGLIETGALSEYRLVVPIERIRIDHTFLELPVGIVPADVMTCLTAAIVESDANTLQST